MRIHSHTLAVVLLFAAAELSTLAQSPAPTAAPVPAAPALTGTGTGIPVPPDVQLRLLKSQHTVDSSNVEMAQIIARWNAMQDERRTLQSQADTATKRITDSQKALDADIDAALVTAKLDKSKWTVNDEKTMFVKRPEPTTGGSGNGNGPAPPTAPPPPPPSVH